MTPRELSAWRKNERARLLRERSALTEETLVELRSRIDHHLERAFPDLVHGILAFCWPYKNEYDARHLAAALRRRGATTALPVVVAPKTPLVFREWRPGVKLAEGPLGIPYPADSPEVIPDKVLLPMVGWDGDGYRLGYGGAFFDRTLAALAKRPQIMSRLTCAPSIRSRTMSPPISSSPSAAYTAAGRRASNFSTTRRPSLRRSATRER